MAAKTVARRTARRASKPKAPKAARKAVRKTKRVTKKSKTGTMRQVWNGTKTWTVGGLTKANLMLSKSSGKVVSKKAHASGKKQAGPLKAWNRACMKARKELGITGFVKMNRGAQGVALYKLAKKYHN